MTVQEVAEYLRIKERKVYDLLAQKRIPCTRVTGKWLFPRFQIDRWLEQNSEIGHEGLVEKSLPPVLVGSHDLLLEWALREIQFPFAIQTTGSSEGLARFIGGDAMVCGLHILDPETDEYNIPIVKEKLDRQQAVVLIEWARRQQGILLARGNPLEVGKISDLTNNQIKIIDRQAGAGSSILLDTLLKREAIDKDKLAILPKPARSEIDVGAAVANGKADAGIAIEAVAKQFGLHFIPLGYEVFDLAIHHRNYFNEPFQRLLDFSRQAALREKADELGGYDVSRLGKIRFNCF